MAEESQYDEYNRQYTSLPPSFRNLSPPPVLSAPAYTDLLNEATNLNPPTWSFASLFSPLDSLFNWILSKLDAVSRTRTEQGIQQFYHSRDIRRLLRRQARIRVLVGDEDSGLSGDEFDLTMTLFMSAKSSFYVFAHHYISSYQTETITSI